jgi:hypothetical protein
MAANEVVRQGVVIWDYLRSKHIFLKIKEETDGGG